MSTLVGDWKLVNKFLDKLNYKVHYKFEGKKVIITGLILNVKVACVIGTWDIKNYDNLQIDIESINLIPVSETISPVPYEITKDFKSMYRVNNFIIPMLFNSIGGYKFKLKFVNNNTKVFLKPLNIMGGIGTRELNKL